jgi:hypothetical protein
MASQYSRINFNSIDNSINEIGIDSDELFTNLKNEIEKIVNESVREAALNLLEEMKQTKGTSSFVQCYMKFMGVIADHLTIAPHFIQALSKLMS